MQPAGYKHSPDTRAKMSKVWADTHPSISPMRGRKHTQESLIKMSIAHIGLPSSMKGKKHSLESIEKMRQSKSGENHPQFGIPRSEETKQKIGLANKGHMVLEETRKKISESVVLKLPEYLPKLKEAWADPEKRKKRLQTMQSEEYRQKIGATVKNRWENSSEYRNRMSGENSPSWNGGISFDPYCPKFNNEFKERVRAWFNYQCIECGTPQNGVKLGVHHVAYNKESCCDSSSPLFVPLCRSCHAKTSVANKITREMWMQHFTDIINTYYLGRTYFTVKEFEEIKNVI